MGRKQLIHSFAKLRVASPQISNFFGSQACTPLQPLANGLLEMIKIPGMQLRRF